VLLIKNAIDELLGLFLLLKHHTILLLPVHFVIYTVSQSVWTNNICIEYIVYLLLNYKVY